MIDSILNPFHSIIVCLFFNVVLTYLVHIIFNSGYGHDKSSHTYHLHLAGYKFIVIPDAFVVHIDHGVPTWRNNANKTRIWVNWYSFALEKEAEFGGSIAAPKLFFSPEWWGSAQRNKEERDKTMKDTVIHV